MNEVKLQTLAEQASKAAPNLRFIVFDILKPSKPRTEYFSVNPDTNELERLQESEGKRRRRGSETLKYDSKTDDGSDDGDSDYVR